MVEAMSVKYPNDEWTGSLVRRISRNLTNILDQKLSHLGITSSQVRILASLWNQDGLTQKDLVQKIGIRPASLTKIIDGMVSKGWLNRRPDPKDGRFNRIYLTQQGKEVRIIVNSKVEEAEEIMLKDFSEEEMAVLKKMLLRMMNNTNHY